MGDTVGEVLEAEGIEVDETHDIVAPGLDEQVEDGNRISVRFGRELELTVDGKTTTHWVTAPRSPRPWPSSAAASATPSCRPAVAPTSTATAPTLEVVTPKKLQARAGRQEAGHARVTALTVEDALEEMRRRGRQARRDQARPRRRRSTTATRSSSPTSASRRSGSSARPSTSAPSSRRTTRCPRARPRSSARAATGMRDVTYRSVYRNGELDEPQGAPPGRARASRSPRSSRSAPSVGVRHRQHRLGRARAVRVRRQLGHQHRQRLLRRPAVQPRHLAGVRRHRAAQHQPAARPRSRSRPRSATPRAATAPGRAARASLGLPM